MAREPKRLGEFDLIAKYFAPLAKGEPGAFDLTDDAAILTPTPGMDLVVTTDAIVAGVHFLPEDPADTIAQKALRVNLSDLAAKGAKPRAYLMTAAFPRDTDNSWLKAFALGLKGDQKRFGLALIGGDTVATPGPLTLGVTAIGEVGRGKMLTRAGAKVGDDIWVTGTIGDAALGLKALNGDALGLDDGQLRHVIERYRVPEPRLAFGRGLVGLAHACLDISDGLIADLGHVSDVSAVAIEIEATAVPLSPAAGAVVDGAFVSLAELLTAGDDYELAFAAPTSARARLTALAARTRTKATRIGTARKGKGVAALDAAGAPLPLARAGYVHF